MDIMAILDGYNAKDEVHDVAEVYSPPRIVPVARRQGKNGGWSLDLTTSDSDGRPWDFDDEATRKRAERLIDNTQPKLLILSPMCTYLSSMMN